MTPRVSIIVPCYNEQATIHHLLEAIFTQTYPCRQMEVVIADALSTDTTREVIGTFRQAHSALALKIVDNRKRTIPSGLNKALENALGGIIVRLDAHCIPAADYVARCVQDLEARKGVNVGGVWDIQPGAPGWVAASIAVAASHPLGAGDAQYRLRANPGAVDTVPFGAFQKSLVDAIGAFDETLLSNEDYEFNARVRRSGGIVWLDPDIRCTYFARPSLSQLARQYWRYGYWKLKMLRRYPDTLRWRQALPPLFVASLILLAVCAAFLSTAAWLLAAEILMYSLVLTSAGLVSAVRRRRPFLFPGLPLAIAVMHFSWGGGFLWSVVSNSDRHG